MNNVSKHMSILGMKVQDKVTKIKGIASSISFDLYGCIQVAITPTSKDNGEYKVYWFDMNRMKILNKIPVMKRPNYKYGHQAEGNQGCAEKPEERVS